MSSAGSAFSCSLRAGREGGERAAVEEEGGGRRLQHPELALAVGAPGAQRRSAPGEGDERTAAPAPATAAIIAACARGAGEEAGHSRDRRPWCGPCALSAGLTALWVRRQASGRPGRRLLRPPEIGAVGRFTSRDRTSEPSCRA